jgi:protein-tyrosine-phosphatase
VSPVDLATVLQSGDLVVTVCDNAHEVLGGLDQVHWSVPDPVRAGTTAAYDDVIHDLGSRVHGLAARLN